MEAKLIPSPDKAEDSEKVVGMSCSATGKPAPKITWHLPSILQQKPREYHIKLGNETVTVISNFTHANPKILQEHPIACVIQHPSLNVTLVLPTDSLEQGQYETLLLSWSGEDMAKHLLGQIRKILRGLGAGGEGTWKSSRGWAWEVWRRCRGASRHPQAMAYNVLQLIMSPSRRDVPPLPRLCQGLAGFLCRIARHANKTCRLWVARRDWVSHGQPRHQTPRTGLLAVPLVCALARAPSVPVHPVSPRGTGQGMSETG